MLAPENLRIFGGDGNDATICLKGDQTGTANTTAVCALLICIIAWIMMVCGHYRARTPDPRCCNTGKIYQSCARGNVDQRLMIAAAVNAIKMVPVAP